MKSDVIVVGGGVIGLACAFELQRRGRTVILMDMDEPGRACSYGNAGIIATSEIFPLITARRVLSLPGMLIDQAAPAAIRASAFPSLLPWLARAAATLLPLAQDRIISGLAALNRRALPAWRELLDSCGGRTLLAERGMIELIRWPALPAAFAARCERLKAAGFPTQILNAEQVAALEPHLAGKVSGGLFHENSAHVHDPYEVAVTLRRAFQAMGGTVIKDKVNAIDAAADGCRIDGAAASYRAKNVVVAAGLTSGHLLRPLGVQVPLQAERGYHMMLRKSAGLLTRPVTFHRESCVATPMSGGLRLAGTVEFAAADAPPSWSRARHLAAFAQHYFTSVLPTEGDSIWMGSRPSLPDSLPAIGCLRGQSAIAYAFGHQHLGLTQAAITAKMIADLIGCSDPGIDMGQFGVERFGIRAR